MSARVESTPVRGSAPRPLVIAVVAALGLGVLAVGMVRLTADDGPAVTTQAPLWDAQKLEAMEGRQLAEVRSTVNVATQLEPGQLKALLEGRQVATESILWDAAKLEAMEGRQVAAAVGTEDPIIAPHIPRRSPRE
jgi:hypothetical protein